jgi:mycothiol synthase
VTAGGAWCNDVVPEMRVVTTRSLTARQADAVRALGEQAARADGVAPLSEQALLVAQPAGREAGAASAHPALQVLGYAGDLLVGYAQLTGGLRLGGGEPSGELVVAPGARRQGLGTRLWAALQEQDADVRVWAHGSLPAARGIAAALGLVAVRELHKMARPLTSTNGQPAGLPDGFHVRAFEPDRDEQAWLSANARAFAGHPEQGRLGLADLRARMQQPWFRTEDFLLVEHDEDPGTIVAFHWMKADAAERSSAGTSPSAGVGEVYALGITPAYQGRGLAGPLTQLGLAHLAALGLTEAILYVDGNNAAALATYRRAGFRSIMVDVMYSRPVHDPPPAGPRERHGDRQAPEARG